MLPQPNHIPHISSTHVYPEVDGSYTWEIWGYSGEVVLKGDAPSKPEAVAAMLERFDYVLTHPESWEALQHNER